MPFHTYDPGKHFISFAGIPLTSIADGTYLTVERMSEQFTSVAGAGGEVARIRNRDKRGSMKLSLLASSVENDILSAIATKDESDASGVGVFNVTDGNGTTVVHASNAWIKKRPSTEFAKEMPMRDWEFECEDLELFVGGNF
jgi:hypothetical protein